MIAKVAALRQWGFWYNLHMPYDDPGLSELRGYCPYVNYVLYTVDEVYEEFESRFAKSGQKRGEKTRSVEAVLNDTEGKFTLRDIEWKCPGVSKETIRSVLKAHPDCFVCEGRGVSARWLKVKNLSE